MGGMAGKIRRLFSRRVLLAIHNKYLPEALEPRVLLAAVLVKDINTQAASSSPSAALTLGNIALFAADDGLHGRELWASDGSGQGTTLLMDIRPGSSGSSPTPLGVFDDYLYFSADDGVHGNELWRTDGTAQGTTLFKDFQPSTATTIFTPFVLFNGEAYFTLPRPAEL